MPKRHIVLGLDGSAGSEAAVAWCAEYAPLLDARVVAVHALLPIVIGELSPPAMTAGYTPEERAAYAADVEGWCAPLRAAGVECETRLVDGVAASTLMRVADDVDAALVVVGRRGHGGFTELLLGSVPHALTHHCTRPVLVVPVA